MVLNPAKNSRKIRIYRGPNIGELPENIKLNNKLDGFVGIKAGDKITTDHIMPAGSRLKYRSNIKKYSEFVFEEVDPDFAVNALKIKNSKKGVFIVAGLSYGQGSSREHAALCPMYLGVKAVFAKSLERIHAANLVNFGILPLVFVNPQDYKKINKNDKLIINNVINALDNNQQIVVENKTKKNKIKVKYNLSDRQKQILKAGGLLNYTRSRE